MWATEGIRPGVVALSHHMGRWRLRDGEGSRWVTGLVDLDHADGVWTMRQKQGVRPFSSADKDSDRIFWDDPGVHQNLTFPVQPDPWSGAHCWLQKVTLEPGRARGTGTPTSSSTRPSRARSTRSGWPRPGPRSGPDGQRRPEFLMRPVKPKRRAFRR